MRSLSPPHVSHSGSCSKRSRAEDARHASEGEARPRPTSAPNNQRARRIPPASRQPRTRSHLLYDPKPKPTWSSRASIGQIGCGSSAATGALATKWRPISLSRSKGCHLPLASCSRLPWTPPSARLQPRGRGLDRPDSFMQGGRARTLLQVVSSRDRVTGAKSSVGRLVERHLEMSPLQVSRDPNEGERERVKSDSRNSKIQQDGEANLLSPIHHLARLSRSQSFPT